MVREIVASFFRMQKRMWKAESVTRRCITVSQILLLHKYMKKYDLVKAIGYQMSFIFFLFGLYFLTVCFNSS